MSNCILWSLSAIRSLQLYSCSGGRLLRSAVIITWRQICWQISKKLRELGLGWSKNVTDSPPVAEAQNIALEWTCHVGMFPSIIWQQNIVLMPTSRWLSWLSYFWLVSKICAKIFFPALGTNCRKMLPNAHTTSDIQVCLCTSQVFRSAVMWNPPNIKSEIASTNGLREITSSSAVRGFRFRKYCHIKWAILLAWFHHKMFMWFLFDAVLVTFNGLPKYKEWTQTAFSKGFNQSCFCPLLSPCGWLYRFLL